MNTELQYSPELEKAIESGSMPMETLELVQEFIRSVHAQKSGFDCFDKVDLEKITRIYSLIGFEDETKTVVALRVEIFNGDIAHPLSIVTVGFNADMSGVNGFSLTNKELV